jgi:hypothetical protein
MLFLTVFELCCVGSPEGLLEREGGAVQYAWLKGLSESGEEGLGLARDHVDLIVRV